MRKFLIGVCLSLIVLFGIGAAINVPDIQSPKGEDAKIADATFALYASSESAGVSNRFVCTAEAVSNVTDNNGENVGYILLTAGHCTLMNPEIPGDAAYSVSTKLGEKLMPVTIVKAVMQEPLDFALLYLPTKQHFNIDPMESISKVRVGDKVTDVNFALGIVKRYSHGEIGSQIIHASDPRINGDFLVQMDGGPGSSGSGVLHDGKLIGIVIYGFNEGNVGMGVESIDDIIRAIPSTPNYVAPAVNEQQDFFDHDSPFFPFLLQRGHVGGHQERVERPRSLRTNQPRERRVHPSHVGRDHREKFRQRDIVVVGGHRCLPYEGAFFFVYGDGAWPV